MYQIININGAKVGITDTVNYILIGNSGDYAPASEEEAIGVAFDGVVYNLMGHSEIDGAETVAVVFEDSAFFARQAVQNSANIDYISMMAGIDLPDEEPEPAEIGREEK